MSYRNFQIILEGVIMVKFISYIIAVIITAILAIVLYPVSAICWCLGQIGKVSDSLFKFTNATIKKLWNDIKTSDMKQTNNSSSNIEQ